MFEVANLTEREAKLALDTLLYHAKVETRDLLARSHPLIYAKMYPATVGAVLNEVTRALGIKES